MRDELQRTVTAKDVAVITIGTIIGSGIFLTPGGVLGNSGGYVGVSLSVWAVGGVLTLRGALADAEPGCMRTGTGGLEGWQYATFVGGEVQNPQRNFPLGLVVGTVSCMVILHSGQFGIRRGPRADGAPGLEQGGIGRGRPASAPVPARSSPFPCWFR